jgi:hypothetical protein
MIAIDVGAGASLGLVARHPSRFARDVWPEDFADEAVYPVVIADLVQLRAELDVVFRRLQARFDA